MKTELMTFTPQQAKDILAKSSGNRKLKKRKIKQFTEDMKNGKWKVNGETVIFDENGNLIDGFHRMNACVASESSFNTLAVYGIDSNLKHIIDTGTMRSNADTIEMYFKNTKYTSVIAAAIRYVKLIKRNLSDRTLILKNDDVIQFIEIYPEFLDFVHENSKIIGSYNCRIFSASRLCACLWIFQQKYDAETVDNFFIKLVSGLGLTEESPIYILRRKMESIKFSSDLRRKSYGLKEDDEIKLIFLGFQKWMQNESIKVMKMPKDLPKI